MPKSDDSGAMPGLPGIGEAFKLIQEIGGQLLYLTPWLAVPLAILLWLLQDWETAVGFVIGRIIR